MADYLSKGLLRSGIDNTRSLIGENIADQEDMFDNFSTIADNNALAIKKLDSDQKKRLKNEKLLVRQIKKDYPGIEDSLANSIAFTIGEQFIPTLSQNPNYSFAEYSKVYENSNLKGGGSYTFDIKNPNRININMPEDTSLGGIDIPKVEADDTSIFKKLFTTDPKRAQSKYGREKGLTTSEAAALGTIGAPLDYDPLSAYDTGTKLSLIPAFEVQGGLTIGQGQAFVDQQLATYDTSFSALVTSGNIVDNPDGSYSFQEKAVNDEEMRYRRNRAFEQVGISGQRGPINPTLISNYIIETQPIADKYKNIETQLTSGSVTDPNSVRRIVAKYRTTVDAGGTNRQGEDLNFIKTELETALNNRDDISDDVKEYLLKNYSSNIEDAKSSIFYTKQYNIDDYKKEIDDVSFKQSIAFRPEDVIKQEEATIENTQESDKKLVEGNLNVNELALNLNIPEVKKPDEVSINDRAENIRNQMEKDFVRENPDGAGPLETAGKTVDSGIDTIKNVITDRMELNEIKRNANNLVLALDASVISIEEKAARIDSVLDTLNMLPEKTKKRLIERVSKFVSNNQDTLGSKYVDDITKKITVVSTDTEEDLAMATNMWHGGTLHSPEKGKAIPRFNSGGTIDNITVRGTRSNPFDFGSNPFGVRRGTIFNDATFDRDLKGSDMMEDDAGYDEAYDYADRMRKQAAKDAKKTLKKGIMSTPAIDNRNILEQAIDVGMLGAPGSKAKIATSLLTDNETINNAVETIANIVDAPFNVIANVFKTGVKNIKLPEGIPGLDKVETALDTAEETVDSNN